MSRLKEMLVILTFFFVKVEMQILGSHNFTSEWLVVTNDSLFPSLVTKTKDHIVYVSFPSDYTIRLETSKIVNKPCEIPATLIKEHNAKNVTPVFAESLGNGKIVVSVVESKKEVNQSNVWLYVIDPRQCTYDLDNFTLDAPIASVRDVMVVVPYQDTFDVFIKSDIHCESGSICSFTYSDKPSLISSRKSVVHYEDEGWDITTTKDYDPNGGYLYVAMTPESNSTSIKQLNSNFEVVQKAELNYTGSIAYWYDESGCSNMCFGLSDQEIACSLLDSQMQVKVEATLFYDNYVQYYSIFRLKNGDAVVLTILSSDPEGTDSTTYVQHVGTDGKISSPIKFQDYICDNVYEMNTFQISDGVFCVSTICQSIVNTKCISPADTREF